jgi:hypothetical protein
VVVLVVSVVVVQDAVIVVAVVAFVVEAVLDHTLLKNKCAFLQVRHVLYFNLQMKNEQIEIAA